MSVHTNPQILPSISPREQLHVLGAIQALLITHPDLPPLDISIQVTGRASLMVVERSVIQRLHVLKQYSEALQTPWKRLAQHYVAVDAEYLACQLHIWTDTREHITRRNYIG